MSPDRRDAVVIMNSRWGTLGDLATAAFMLAAIAGVALAVPYDPKDSYGSIATLLLVNPAAVFFRNVHYWAGQLCLVLTLVHMWEHLRAKTESRVSRGKWLRLALTLPLVVFIMLSGFLLRGDADAQQALRLLTEATTRIPMAGPLLATLIFGAGDRLDLIYIQHAATATIVVWLFVIEHARRMWPRPSAFLAVTAVVGGVSLFLTPGLHDGLDPVIKGPWYFLGLQEILHWTPWPTAVVVGSALIVTALYAVRVLPATPAARTKGVLLILVMGYAGLCVIGAFARGENWAWSPSWPSGTGNTRVGWVFTRTSSAPRPLPVPLQMAMGRPEGCLVCHGNVTGLGNAHRAEAVGCAACHGGDVLTIDKARAHAGMDLIPGNLATAQRGCGQSACHASIVPRVERSLMTTMSGIVSVNRRVFDEASTPMPDTPPHIQRLGRSAADTHLRQLCAACHLGGEKTDWGPNGENSRGGGCNACHLSYSPAALDALRAYEQRKRQGVTEAPTVHPALSLAIDNGQCFGCHSRSGRISTSYEGWHEMHDPPADAAEHARLAPARFRRLEDERIFERVTPDIHQQRGLDCVDCHTATEVMGDGVLHARKRDALRVTCTDCHAPAGGSLPRTPAAQIDPESRRIVALRAWPGPVASHYVRTATGDTLVNAVADAVGPPQLVRKRTGERLPLKPTAAVCVEGQGHARLSCGSCHTAWAPRCSTCHTSFDAKTEAYDWVDDANVVGSWKEKAGPFVANRPTLGIRRVAPGRDTRADVIDTFVPGMILTVDRNRTAGGPSDVIFRRLYARIEPHTTRRETRTCESCHNDPEAIGYGRGALRYERSADGGRWRFTAASPSLPQDGLPADAWIPFLGTRTGMVSTQDDVRPFTVEEQQRILRVGACLTCHPGSSRVMRDSVRDFDALVARRSPRCVLPIWRER